MAVGLGSVYLLISPFVNNLYIFYKCFLSASQKKLHCIYFKLKAILIDIPWFERNLKSSYQREKHRPLKLIFCSRIVLGAIIQPRLLGISSFWALAQERIDTLSLLSLQNPSGLRKILHMYLYFLSIQVST